MTAQAVFDKMKNTCNTFVIITEKIVWKNTSGGLQRYADESPEMENIDDRRKGNR